MANTSWFPGQLATSVGFTAGCIATGTVITSDNTGLTNSGIFQQDFSRLQQYSELQPVYVKPKPKTFIEDIRDEMDEWLKDALV